jgi:pilus assembly protein CpaF
VFAIVISEKGGAERREVFDRPEISVGRVQGNDLMLPKGNVSKRHARLLCRDGRFIVTDLNSTNGTYVNRRRISQPTIVREGDRIYVGDFVLRIEQPEGGEGSGPGEGSGSGPVPARASAPQVDQVVSGFPSGLEESASYPDVPGPPRVPSAARASTATLEPGPPIEPSSASRLPVASPSLPRSDSGPSLPVPESSADAETLAYRRALVALVTKVSDAVGPDVLDGELGESDRSRIERAIEEQLPALRNEGELSSSVAPDRLHRDARAELVELGGLGALLNDPEVSEISAPRYDRISFVRSARWQLVEPPLSSAAALERVIARMCRHAGEPLKSGETIIERRLPGGGELSAVIGRPALSGPLLVVRKPRRVALSIDDLVRSGTISRAIATFLQHAVAARANILVTGPKDTGTSSVLSALAAAAGAEAGLVVIEDLDDVVAENARAARLSIVESPGDSLRLVRVAARSSTSRLVVELATSELTGATLEAIAQGADGVIAALSAPSARRALARVTADLLATQPGLGAAAAREAVALSFDLLVEVNRLRDGRHRVLSVSELNGVADDAIRVQEIFTFTIERTAAGGAIEGTFNASGVVPRLVEEMNARGVPLETSLFSRPPSR